MKIRTVVILLNLCFVFTLFPTKAIAAETFSPEQPAPHSSSEKLGGLIDYIVTHGKQDDKDSAVYIEKTYSLEAGVASGEIHYGRSKENVELLHFECYLYIGTEDSNSESFLFSSFDYDIKSEKECSSMLVMSKHNEELNFAEADFAINTYNPATTALSFKDLNDEHVSDYYNDFYTVMVKQSTSIWNGMLYSMLGIQLNDIGFINYSDEETNPPEQPDQPDKPDSPETLNLSVGSGGLGKKVTLQITGGHWLTVQVRRAGSVSLSSIQAPGSGKVPLSFSAATGSTIRVWETEAEMTFNTQGVPNNKILATASQTL